MERSMSLATLKVLRALMDDLAIEHYGLELSERSGVKPGALYPILSRLEADGWVEGEWEDIDESAAGRRRRRYYRLSPGQETAAGQILAETAAALAPPGFAVAATTATSRTLPKRVPQPQHS
jgi:DNA-binding PadR family transcriptional regulator